ncbi:hypothetical protein R3W88_003771 [Solanum pinnatisectum]|uniref:Uncharacterized protein n=1 Tax=Solanum pinnatisectum TaxID=50273 RepID=A0AAV9MSU1_9SOLN|nr:hypothetical protein R3W88_003771 [Solanum pinnatisectum]
MVIQRLEMCIGIMELVFEFIIVFIEAVSTVFCQNDTSPAERNYITAVPYIGLLP